MTRTSFERALRLSKDSGLTWHSKVSRESFARDMAAYLDVLPEPGWVKFIVSPTHPYFSEDGAALLWTIGVLLAENSVSYRLCDYMTENLDAVTVVLLRIRDVGLIDLTGN